MIKGPYTLITGASTGLGKALAIECARHNRNLLLTALPGEKIDILGNEIKQKYGVEVICREADLTTTGTIEELNTEVFQNYELDMLINNAGIGGTLPFTEASTGYIDKIMLLNIRALVLLTKLLLPQLKKQKRSYILNIASMASFGPIPFKTVYPASKAFVYSFSRGLCEELKGSGVSVSVAFPGGMKTNPDVTRRIENHNKIIRATTLPVEKVARICILHTLKNDEIIVPGMINKVSWLVLKIVPVGLRLRIMGASMQKEIQGKKIITKTA